MLIHEFSDAMFGRFVGKVHPSGWRILWYPDAGGPFKWVGLSPGMQLLYRDNGHGFPRACDVVLQIDMLLRYPHLLTRFHASAPSLPL